MRWSYYTIIYTSSSYIYVHELACRRRYPEITLSSYNRMFSYGYRVLPMTRYDARTCHTRTCHGRLCDVTVAIAASCHRLVEPGPSARLHGHADGMRTTHVMDSHQPLKFKNHSVATNNSPTNITRSISQVPHWRVMWRGETVPLVALDQIPCLRSTPHSRGAAWVEATTAGWIQ